MLCQKSLHKSCRMGRCIVGMKMICSIGHCEHDGHTVHKLSQRRLTADWLASRESDCSRMHSKVSSDWLPSYIKATRPVLEILKMDGYFLDRPHMGVIEKWRCVKFKRLAKMKEEIFVLSTMPIKNSKFPIHNKCWTSNHGFSFME